MNTIMHLDLHIYPTLVFTNIINCLRTHMLIIIHALCDITSHDNDDKLK